MININKNINKNKLILSLVASSIFISSVGLYNVNKIVFAESVSTIDNDSNNLNLKSDKLDFLSKEIKASENARYSLEEETENLEYKIVELEEEVSNLENKISYFKEYLINKEIEIEDLNSLLSDLINESESSKLYLESYQSSFKERLNLIYKEYNKSDYMLLQVLLNSDGFFDMLNNLNVFKEIISNDNDEVIEYMSIIESYEKSKKETQTLLDTMELKLKEYEFLISDLNNVLLNKLKTEDNLNSILLNKKSEINLSESKVLELEKLFIVEREHLYELFMAEKEAKLKEKEKEKERIAKESQSVNNDNVNNNNSKIVNNLSFSGDKSFEEYQSSINWAKNKSGADVFESYYNLIDKYSKEYGIPSWLIKGIIMTESSFNKSTANVNTNGTVDRGLMQMNSNTAPGVARHVGFDYYVGIEFVPENNIKMGSYYIAAKLKETGSDYHKGLTSYNRGNTGAKRYYETNGTYESSYSKKVLGYAEVFKKEEENL